MPWFCCDFYDFHKKLPYFLLFFAVIFYCPYSTVIYYTVLICSSSLCQKLVICSKNRIPGSGSKIHYPVPNLGNWYRFCTDFWWNTWKSRYLQLLWRNSVLQERFNFSHYRWRTNIHHRCKKRFLRFYLRQGGYVFARVCLFVCLCVSKIAQKVMKGFFWNFQGMLGMAKLQVI